MNRVLVVDDEPGMRAALEANFTRHGWEVTTASGTREAMERFRSSPCPLVITDMRMPDGDGLRVMQHVRALAPDTAVIFLTAFGNVPEAVLAMQRGACDYLIKPVSFEQLRQAAARVLGSTNAGTKGSPPGGMVGHSAGLRLLMERACQVARSDADVLIMAESGTGKELLAQFIHRTSVRRDYPLVPVNCAAFPEALLESELFGHVRGAFTGAVASRPGKFELASGGTLLLDEISEMPLSLQPKLLRVLQEREVDRLGDTRPLRVDVRVIATTNRDLPSLIEEGRFRADLFYRLDVVPLTLPPLRARREDIPDLVEHFVRKYAPPSRAFHLTEELLQRLTEFDWPGNVRELENFVRRILVLSSNSVVGVEVLGEKEIGDKITTTAGFPAQGVTLRDMERQLLERTLEATGGNRTRAAEILGVSLRTVRNKIREFGLPPKRSV
ncbi:MAG TPA: sigma-54 dependent transcriptional regulator [Terriglobia bacterium]|nr:sigma-54 dependent transcriptional regulator [Terriglobia bacterium]